MGNAGHTKRNIGRIALAVITIHVIIGIAAVLLPHLGINNRLLIFYQRFLVSGPYFTDATIKSSRHLYVGYKYNNQWVREKDFAQDDFGYYCAAPWRYDKLSIRQYPLYAAWRLSRINDATDARYLDKFQLLTSFSKNEWIKKPIDSISFTYCSRSYNLKSLTYDVDTLFTFKGNAR